MERRARDGYSAPRMTVGRSASSPPITRPSAKSRSALHALCGIKTRAEGWATAVSGRDAKPDLAERGA
eukprot:5884468-Pleurochrysis_carterae.AAC.8